jgi:CubicO group peptidase (beta-lactamase class C family)
MTPRLDAAAVPSGRSGALVVALRLAALGGAAISLSPASFTQVAAQEAYYPGPGDAWERRTPEEVGMSSVRLREAIARAEESRAARDLLAAHRASFGREPMGEAIGPFRERADPTGLVVRHGYIVAEWGDPERVDLAFSVTKSFLSTTVGLAYDRGMIRDVHDTVREYFAPVVALRGPPSAGETLPPPADGAAYSAFEVILPFESEHNRKITWDHLLRQTSDWQGTLWGKPDWADRPRGDIEQWRSRPRYEPGTYYMYNDVRVNLLALAALNVWRRPLPEVLKEHVMDPIGASHTWRWFGYDNSWVVMDGRLVQSVSGGAHWGGGMWISALDMARFGYLTLRRGRWADRQILSDEWVAMALTPTPGQRNVGFMNWFLRGEEQPAPFYHSGNGPNVIYVDPQHDLVVVTRWIANWDAVVAGIVGSVENRAAAR